MTTLPNILTPQLRKPWDVSLDAFKVLAFSLMVLDHVAAFAQASDLWRLPGRFVLPMFAVALAHKFTWYSSGRMVNRLLIWALVAQVLLAPIGRLQLNILFTLGIGLFVASQDDWKRVASLVGVLCLCMVELALGGHVVEYGTPGILLVALACLAQREPVLWLICPLLAYLGNLGGADGMMAALGVGLSLAYIYREKVFAWVRYVPTHAWYALYPLHLLLIWLVVALLR